MKKRVLVVSDDESLRKKIIEVIAIANYAITEAASGKEAIDRLTHENPDLILCSVAMKALDGYRVLRTLNADHALSLIPIIMLGSGQSEEEQRKVMDMGADDYLDYPLDTTELLRAIEARIAKSELARTEYSRLFSVNAPFNNSIKPCISDLISPSHETRSFQKKQLIYKEGDRQNFLYYIKKGHVKNFKVNSEGKELIIDIHKPGDFIGCHSLLSDMASPDSAIAMDDVEVSLVSKKECLDVIQTDSRLSAEFMSILSKDVISRNAQLLRLAYNSVRRRLADALLLLADKLGYLVANNVVIEIGRRDLAGLTGITKESVIRTLSDFKQEGLVDIVDQKIVLLQPAKLHNMPN